MLIHVKYKGASERSIIMLHGTGGNESDLRSIASQVDPEAHLIGVRGSVEENGMLRYFKRYPDGTFDLKDLAMNTKLLHDGILELLNYYELDATKTTIMGYSNGANIAINMFKEFETPFSKAILFHPSPVRLEVPVMKQEQLQTFLSYGENDPFLSASEFETLKDQFADTNIFVHQGGHQLTYDEVSAAHTFYNK